MIDKEKICQEIEKYINNEIDVFDASIIKSYTDPVEKFLGETAIRLVNEYTLYKNGVSGKSDYLSVLRNFLLCYKTDIEIKDSELLQNNHFGIHLINNNRYLASQDLPEFFTNKSFAEAATITSDTVIPKKNNDYLLETNEFIYKLTGFENFKSLEQKLCVYGAINTPKGFTTLVCMPTGGGKSLISQTLAYSEDGLTIVVVPTVSLAIDQARAAKNNIKRDTKDQEIFSYYSGVKNVSEIYKAIENHKAKLLFISPEALLKNEEFKSHIKEVVRSHYLKNIVIDEAHIVVAWGDFFRVDYQCLAPWREKLLKINPDIRTYLLSATFDDYTVKILKGMFSTNHKWVEIRCDSLRKEPRFSVIKANGYYDKQKKVLELVNKLPHPMILYVRSPEEAESWKQYLEQFGYHNVKTFHGDTKSKDRETLIQQWINNEFNTMIATSAFGVGVDKSDVRTVIHLYVPESADAYYQELGRGGRDGLPCLSVMCINPKEDIPSASNISKVLTGKVFYNRWRTLLNNPRNPKTTDNTISIDVSIEPSKDEQIVTYRKGNSKDIQWNINVLLLLSRYNEIHIENIESSSDGIYIFTIKILNDVLLKTGDELLEHLTEIREKEKDVSAERFNVLRSQIHNVGKVCWSDMFTEIYPLVSEYCAGCDQHTQPEMDEENRFPLLEKITGIRRKLNDCASDYFGTLHEAIYINSKNKPISSVLNFFKKLEYNVIVTDEYISNENGLPEVPGLIIMNYREFRNLMNLDDHFLVSGLIVAVLHMNNKDSLKNFYSVQKYANRKKGYVIYVVDENVQVNNNGKQLSEIIDGPIITDNSFGGD